MRPKKCAKKNVAKKYAPKKYGQKKCARKKYDRKKDSRQINSPQKKLRTKFSRKRFSQKNFKRKKILEKSRPQGGRFSSLVKIQNVSEILVFSTCTYNNKHWTNLSIAKAACFECKSCDMQFYSKYNKGSFSLNFSLTTIDRSHLEFYKNVENCWQREHIITSRVRLLSKKLIFFYAHNNIPLIIHKYKHTG